MPHPDGVQLRFSRETETAVYRSLPHHVGNLVAGKFPVPVGYIAGHRSEENRQAGLDATRALVGRHFRTMFGGHLFPMESPQLTAQLISDLIFQMIGDGVAHQPMARRRA
jgi:hypothetical protein